MTSNTIKHVWFDFAGTLYKETAEFHKAHDTLRIQTYAELQKIDDLEVAEKEFLDLYTQHGSNSAVFRSLGQSADYWMKALDGFEFTELLVPDEEVSKTLVALSKVVPVSLFTNFVTHRVIFLLDHLHISKSVFTHILTGDQIAEKKPALDGFYEMVRLSELRPEEILYVGDRVDADIKPAKQLGIKTALLYQDSDEADYRFEQLSDALRLFD